MPTSEVRGHDGNCSTDDVMPTSEVPRTMTCPQDGNLQLEVPRTETAPDGLVPTSEVRGRCHAHKRC
eukprot:6516279-Alexandrium_andersonii.AAC.1